MGKQQQEKQQVQQQVQQAQQAAQQQDSEYYAQTTVPSNIKIKKVVTREYDAEGNVISDKESNPGR